MPDHHDDVYESTEALHAALQDNGITLPSLGIDLPSLAGSYGIPLVALGNCNAATARKLAEALRKAAEKKAS
ncbi:hypothetical protein [Streptomyces natalensis]|uniref:Uncharacterized protein n=1 Tax=Streptomyces natalensis ATCC 27448 TaxID=1240678 RepID=A0A0D7CV79_9ACTN|nr:hypothetical protein [Streptomyces natalensis]KIZ19725.1 hypothetical protein SNA_00620 [Streptomyces natalensis ATCC 27448]